MVAAYSVSGMPSLHISDPLLFSRYQSNSSNHNEEILLVLDHRSKGMKAGGSLLAVYVHQLQLKVTDALLVGRLKHEGH